MKKRTIRFAMAAAGAIAFAVMGGMSVAAGATRTLAKAVPEHFGGPVYTSI
jgi:hypothetical protein